MPFEQKSHELAFHLDLFLLIFHACVSYGAAGEESRVFNNLTQWQSRLLNLTEPPPLFAINEPYIFFCQIAGLLLIFIGVIVGLMSIFLMCVECCKNENQERYESECYEWYGSEQYTITRYPFPTAASAASYYDGSSSATVIPSTSAQSCNNQSTQTQTSYNPLSQTQITHTQTAQLSPIRTPFVSSVTSQNIASSTSSINSSLASSDTSPPDYEEPPPYDEIF